MQMSRYFLELAYLGTNFHGWQIQHNAHSIQAELQNALSLLLRTSIEVMGCGRTDTGVHATKFYAHFHYNELPFDGDKFCYKLNSILNNDVVIYKVFKVNHQDHARFSATLRSYNYHCHLLASPFLQNRSYFLVKQPNVSAMNIAAAHLLEVDDFAAFCKANSDNHTTLCKVTVSQWHVNGDTLTYTVAANRFLRNMVRSIVGTLLQVGYGKINLAEFKNIILSGNRSLAGESVPAHGLYLTDVKYPFINE